MGILKHLLFWPVTGPAFLARFSVEKVEGVVKEELTDEGKVKEALLELQLRLELGEIEDEEYRREEALLMEQLRSVRHWRETFGMDTRGGIVSAVDGSPEAGTGKAPTEQAPPPRPTLDVSASWVEDETRVSEEGDP